jgi:hypothetical protein
MDIRVTAHRILQENSTSRRFYRYLVPVLQRMRSESRDYFAALHPDCHQVEETRVGQDSQAWGIPEYLSKISSTGLLATCSASTVGQEICRRTAVHRHGSHC